jgi:hypothetical protein
MQAANPVEGRFGFISGSVEPGVVGVGVLIQITPQLRILVAIDAIDGRKYAPSIGMRSFFETDTDRFTRARWKPRSRRA